MNLDYDFHTTESGTLVMKLPNHLQLIEDFLVSDVGFSNGSRYLKALNRAVQEEHCEEQLTGNTTTLFITSSTTRVFNHALDSECEIDTPLLQNIVEIYARNVYVHKLELKLKRNQELIAQSVKEIVGSTGDKLLETIAAVDDNLKKWA